MKDKPKVDTGVASAQMQQLATAAETASERVRAAEESFKKTKDDILGMFGSVLGAVEARTLVMMLDACFTHGQIYGESSETVMQTREQIAMLGQMLKDVEETTRMSKERDARTEKRDNEIRERDVKMMRLTERQVAALEALTKVTPKAAPKKRR
jgi:hypothetical protein